MKIYDEYRSKLKTPEEAVKVIKSGDWVDYCTGNGFPRALDAALAARKEELHDVKVRGNLIFGPIKIVECDPEREHFIYNSWHCSVYDEHMVGLYGASFLNNGVIQQILDSVPDPARDTEGVRKAGSELEAEKWEQAKEQISKWLNKAAPGILNLVEPMIVDSVIEVADKQYLVIHADPLDSEITSGLNLVVILYVDGHCDIKEYSCYGAG